MIGSSDEFEPGKRLGDFQIERRIGRGGMGSVYLAEDTRLRRAVAVKVILPELAERADFRRRFEEEARGAAAIEHPNLVPVYSAGLLDGRLYLAMRFIEGQNLGEALEAHGPLSEHQATVILSQIASALDAAHAAGLVHRDVSPANILLEGELGEHVVYLTDFGLVRGLDATETRLTRTAEVIANLDYSAPEQIQDGRIDARTDVYSLGCVLYRMRSGERPFPGTDTQKMWKIAHEPLPPLPVGGDLLDPVIARATAKDPAHRYLSAGDLARAVASPQDAVTRRLRERSVASGAAAEGYYEGAEPKTEPLRAAEASTAVRPAQPRKRSRGPMIAMAAAAVALTAGVAVVVVLIAGSGGEASPAVVRETVTTTTEAVAPPVSSAGQSEASQSHVPDSSPHEVPASPSSSPGLEEFAGGAYAGLAPTGWERELIDEPVSDYYENLWREPYDPDNTFIRIDGGNPQSLESPVAASEPLVEEVRRDPEYREISYGPDYKDGREAARWVYELDGDKRADYFFVACGQGLASLGSTSPQRYPELAQMFRDVAFATQIYCGE